MSNCRDDDGFAYRVILERQRKRKLRRKKSEHFKKLTLDEKLNVIYNKLLED